MKTIFRMICIASAAVAAVACGGNNQEQAQQAVDTTPTVAVQEVTRRDVPQEAVYTTTVQAFVKNNIFIKVSATIGYLS